MTLSHLDVAATGGGDVDKECAVFVGSVGHIHYIGVECASCGISG